MGVGVYFQAFKTSLLTKLEYRSDFFLGISAAIGLQAASLGTLSVVLFHSPSLQGWDGIQIALLFGLTTMIQGLSELLFNHVWYVPVYILRGQIDRLLVYPVKSLPFFLLTSPELHSLGNLTGGLVIFSYAAHHLGLPWQVYASIPYWVLCGCLVHTSALVVCCALSFIIVGRNSQQYWVVNALLQATRYPLSIYPGAMQYVLLFLLPFGAINFLPISWALGRLTLINAYAIPALAAAVSVFVAFKSWNYGLKKYESTGS